MHHDETGSSAVRQGLLNPFPAIPEFAGFELNADMSAMAFKGAGFSGPAWHSNLAHDGVQEIISVWWFFHDATAGLD